MTKHYFAEMMAELGFHTVDGVAVGVVKGWPCSAVMEKEGFTVCFVAAGDTAPCAKALKEQETAHTVWRAGRDAAAHNQGLLLADISLPSEFYTKATLRTAVETGGRELEKAGLKPPQECPLCGGSGCDRWAFLNEACRGVHKACLQNRLELPEEDNPAPAKVKGYILTGILGALLGAFIAALPNWAQALSKGVINPILYAFLPFMAALLYRLFRGKAKRAASGIIVLLSSLLVAFALELVWYWLVVTTAAGHNMSLAATTALYFESHTFGIALREMSFSLLFLILGFFPAAVLLRRYAAQGAPSGKMQRGAGFVKKSAFSMAEGELFPDIPPEGEAAGPSAGLPKGEATPELPGHSTESTEVMR